MESIIVTVIGEYLDFGRADDREEELMKIWRLHYRSEYEK